MVKVDKIETVLLHLSKHQTLYPTATALFQPLFKLLKWAWCGTLFKIILYESGWSILKYHTRAADKLIFVDEDVDFWVLGLMFDQNQQQDFNSNKISILFTFTILLDFQRKFILISKNSSLAKKIVTDSIWCVGWGVEKGFKKKKNTWKLNPLK